MVIVLFSSLVWLDGMRKKVYIPVSPDTVAGCMYYLCESRMLKDFHQGMALMGARERDRLVREMDKLYSYGEMRDTSGRVGTRRVGVDYYPLSSAEEVTSDSPGIGEVATGSC